IASRFDARLFAASSEQLPGMLKGLGRRRLRRAAEERAGSSLRAKVAALAASERARALLELVTNAVSTVLGASPTGIDADRPLGEIGLDSLMAVELRNRLASLAGVRLPSTLLFDHPTPNALCRYLDGLLMEGGPHSSTASAPKSPSAASAEPIAIV